MPISGPAVHQQLIAALNQYQQRYNADRQDLAGNQQARDGLDARRSDALIDLARFYLPELTPEVIAGTWIEVRGRITEILRRQEAEVTELAGQMESSDRRRQTLDAELVDLNQSLDQAMDRQAEMSDQVERALRDDASFAELSDRAAKAELALERAEQNLAEIEQDAARKLPAYEESTLFQYLHRRKFGTPEYSHRGFTRRMDRRLARFIGYRDAARGYRFLKETPDRMRQIIADDRTALATVMEELERRRDEVAAEVGLTDQIARVGEMVQRRTNLVDRLNDLLIEIDSLRHRITAARDTRGPHYREAIEAFRGMLDGFHTADLQRRAARTVDITDDQIVDRIEGAEQGMEQLEATTTRRQRQLARRQELLSELGRLIQRFRAAGFDSARSQFVGSLDIIGALDTAMREGETDPSAMEHLWNSIRSAQRWGPSAMDQLTDVATHPLTQVLVSAMAHAAGGALQNAARNAGRRRGHGGPFGRRRGGSHWGPWGDSRW